jgi:hypothetical protein
VILNAPFKYRLFASLLRRNDPGRLSNGNNFCLTAVRLCGNGPEMQVLTSKF